MKAVFLILSFIAVLILVQLFAIKLREWLRAKEFHKRNKENISKIKETIDEIDHSIKNTDSRIVLSGTLNDKQNLDSKYIGNVYRAKNGRFVSKKELSNV